MKLKIDRSSFFSSSKSHTATIETEQELHLARAAYTIQRWWKKLHLKQTALESFHYVHDMISLQQAHEQSFPQLEKFILAPKTLKTTHQLLMHLEQAKDIILPSRMSFSNVYQTERQFLAAYMIVSNSKLLFEAPTDIDELLLSRAEEMLKSFEDLCAFMSNVYLKEDALPTISPLAESTPFADQVLLSLNSGRIKSDSLFMTEGGDYLASFHNKQMAYYETFTEWESKNLYKLARILIAKYLEIESQRFRALHSLDPRMLELYEGYGNQQEILRKRLSSLLGEEGIRMLSEELNKVQDSLEANKWITSPNDALIHELALNPKLLVSSEACTIRPQKDINAAITALAQESTGLILDVLSEIRNILATFTPNNRQQFIKLQQIFSQEAMKTQIETLGLQEGLHVIITALFEQIQLLESPVHLQETKLFLKNINQRMNEAEDTSSLLKEALDYIYYKMSQINLELNNFQINQSRGLISRNIVAFEQRKFQERLSGKQFNLQFVLGWIDKFVSAPQDYRLDLPILCSQHLGFYVSSALLVAVLQQPENTVLHTIPETFYLDRLKVVNWHTQYQNLIYTATALGYLEAFCHDYGVMLSSEELLQQKSRLVHALEAGALNTPQEKADDLIAIINRLLIKNKKELTFIDQDTLKALIEKCCLGTNQVNQIINKRLGEQLSFYLLKGYLPERAISLVRRYGLETELNNLGKEILPVLRLHTKVHGPFYQQQMEQCLWKPLFTVLRQSAIPTTLPSLFSPERENIYSAHTFIHKLAFVLSGLALIQQTVVYSDMWNLNLTIKNTTLKELAVSFGLIDMIKNPNSTKDAIESRLMELMQHVANEYELPYEASDKRKMARMVRLVKDEKSLGCKAFLDELIHQTKQFVMENKVQINPNNLVGEFKEEISQIGIKTKEMIQQIKNAHHPYDLLPEAATLPLLRSGRALGEM
ncbi:TCP11-related protein [Legionella cincinnatiensis]|uniref:T-complex protein 11 n=1 Tax=Legionella cincinnatiensis TaxID=28085 RepID=A0A378IM20_9GAMM|nr:TCP11-related protein [Legionella cincinnatiensis]KTC83914.1 T-complex protein 11 [Legionella cincinnatiensis]STX36206.1 T-complex protein 11 [Legionella cincinnatiensis]